MIILRAGRRTLAGLKRLLGFVLGAGSAIAAVAGGGAFAAAAPGALDNSPRIAVISAFPPELAALERATTIEAVFKVRGTRFVAGSLEGRKVVLFLSGVSMVNAAMNAERAIEAFNLTAVVFSGIAGGVDPELHVGDVVRP